MTDEPNMDKILDTIGKLFAKSQKAGTPEEAATFAAKAQELMDKWNLDTVALEKRSGVTSGKREEAKVTGGYYAYQRRLFTAVAELHFCMYFAEEYADKRTKDSQRYNPNTGETYYYGAGRTVWKTRHRIIGRTVNVKATQVMATYLMQAINRLLRERLTRSDGTIGAGQMTGNWATSWREGAIYNIVSKIRAERRLQEYKRGDAAEKAAKMAGSSAETALTLVDVADAEEAANYDFLNGDGAWALRLQRRAEDAEEDRIEQERYAQWAADNPEEAAAEEAERRKNERARAARSGRSRSSDDKTDYGAFSDGNRAADKISLHQQTEGTKVAGRIGNG